MRPLAALAVLAALGPGCTFVTHVDVCDRTGPPEHDVNQRTEGDQIVEPQGLARVPGGGGFLVLTSTSASGVAELRRARLDADATSLPTCEMQGEPTVTSPSTETTGADAAAVAFPAAPGEPGLLVHHERTASGERLWARPVSENGCTDNFGATPPLLVADPGPGVSVGFAHIAPLGGRRFAISWVELSRPSPSSAEVHLYGRVLDEHFMTWLETRRAPSGEAVQIPPDGDFALNHTLVPMGDGRFGLLWYESSISRFRVRFAVFDDRFAVVAGPVLLHEANDVPLLDAPTSLAAAFDGAQVFLSWVLFDETDGGRAFGTFLTANAEFLRSERAPDGGRFRIGSLVSGTETDLSATTLPSGGFLVAWTERDALGRTDATGTGIRALGFDAAGAVLFANRACDRADFPLALDFAGDQSRPVLTTLDDATLLFVYTSQSGVSNDRSGSGLRGVGLRESDLFTR
jgi:hypothetical protein